MRVHRDDSGAAPRRRHVGSPANLLAVAILLCKMCLKCKYEYESRGVRKLYLYSWDICFHFSFKIEILASHRVVALCRFVFLLNCKVRVRES